MHKKVLAAVINKQEKYLVCQRPAHKHHGGLWEFPGGKMEPGEQFHDTATRELHEELNLEVATTGPVELTVDDESSGYRICFVHVDVKGDPKLNEHSALLWASEEQLSDLRLAPSDKIFAEHLRTRSQMEGK